MRPHPSYRHDNFASELKGRRSAERRTVHGPHCIGRCRQRTMPGAAAGIVEARSPSGALTAALATGCHPDGSAPDPCFLGRGSEGCFARLRPVLSPASSSRSGRSAGRWCPGAARERIATPRAGTALASRSGVPREHVPHRRGDPLISELVTHVNKKVTRTGKGVIYFTPLPHRFWRRFAVTGAATTGDCKSSPDCWRRQFILSAAVLVRRIATLWERLAAYCPPQTGMAPAASRSRKKSLLR
jgi:hypothetical protein